MDSDQSATLVFGASGLIGRYLYARLKNQGRAMIGTRHQNGGPDLLPFDLENPRLEDLPAENVRQAVICSAVTKLDKCKNNPDYSHRVNVLGMEDLIRQLTRRGILPVFLSSAAVFDGLTGNYREEDPVNPTTVYGRQKKQVEDFITKNCRDYLVIRPGKVFGIKPGEGVLFADWLDQYRQGREIRLADDEQLSPSLVSDVADGIALLLEKKARGIYHLNPREHYSRYDLAERFFKSLGLSDVRLTRCSIDDFGFAEIRPRNTYLDPTKFIRQTGFSFTTLEKCFKLIAQEHGCLNNQA